MQEQEQGKYTIGGYTFRTFHEYRDGQEDVRKIECINKELNIQDPEVAVRLYNDIRSGRIVFKTPIGDEFFAHLADIVADKSVGLLEDKAVVEEAEGKVKYQKVLGVVFVILAVVSFAVFGIAELRDILTTRKMQQLAEQVEQQAAQARERAAASARRLAGGRRRNADDVPLSEADEALLGALYALRKRLAAKQKVPAYMIFNDATLREMARKKPLSLDELLNITGVGEKKAAHYGRDFLRVIEEMVESRG